MSGIRPATDAFPWPTVPFDVPLLLLLSQKTTLEGNQYRLGGKAPSLESDSATVARVGIDCSGYVRWIVYRASGVAMPDGSWHQAAWADRQGFKTTTVEAGGLKDGRVRLAYMKPLSEGGVGHIALVLDGQTIESSGKRGPGRRPWTGQGWQSRCRLWVLA